jgi:hypothetical protein
LRGNVANAGRTGPFRRGAARIPATLALAGVAGSLVYRVWSRGPWYPGWDVLGSAHGLYVLTALPLGEALERLYAGVRHFRYWNATNSLPYTLVPGELSRLWHSQYWADWLTFGLVLVTFWLVLRFAELPLRRAWVLALAWGASPALLSFSVAGYPYVTGFLPHALALVIVTSPWLRARPLLSLAAALFATELSWHLYEAGKTLVVVFVVAALVERAAPKAVRAGWLLAGAAQAALLVGQRGYNVNYVLKGAGAGIAELASSAGRTVATLFRAQVDLPVVVPLGLVAMALVRRRRWLLVAGVASQLLTLALAGAVEAGAIRPRRLLTTSFYCLTAIAVFLAHEWEAGDWRRRLRLPVMVALASAGLWQVADAAIFFGVPPSGRSAPLPYTQSKDDYQVAWGETRLAHEVAREVGSGGAAVVLYNLSSEPIADPAGLMERIYLQTGPDLFSRSVLSFGRHRCRYDCMPIRPLEDLEKDVAALAAGGRRAVAFYKKAPGTRRHVEEAAMVLAAVRRHFDLVPTVDPAPGFGAAGLVPRRAVEAPLDVLEATAALPLDLAWLPNPRDPGGVVLTSPEGERPFRYAWSARVDAGPAGAAVDLLLGCDGGLRLDVDGRTASSREVLGLSLWRERLDLSAGSHSLDLAYESRSGAGRLLLGIESAREPAPGRTLGP